MPRRCKNNWEIGEILNNLEDSNKVIVPNDKTYSSRSVTTKQI